jgi:exodeoxyribonuclease VII small subunit
MDRLETMRRTKHMTNEQKVEELTFEEALIELDRMVRELEEGRLGLEESLARYEQGVGLVRQCYARLRAAEQKILLLSGSDENQVPILQPFKHEATAVARADGPRRIRKKNDGAE